MSTQIIRLAALAGLGLSLTTFAPAQVVPVGFVDSLAIGGLNQPTGVAFAPDGRAFIWEKGGLVKLLEGGVIQPTPVIDVSQEVGDWRDFGLLGFAIDPNFAANGFVYLSYTVDYHHARYFGTPQYSPTANEYFRDTIGRVTRYQLNAADNFRSLVPGSRTILIGESLSTGIPAVHQSHHIGSLAFGEDGTLIVGAGDGGSYEEMDNGGPRSGSSNTGLADGIITAAENVGAFRAQLLDSHCGKMLRIDPATGDGVPSNPFYNAASPRSPRSRVWAMGFRNPYRFSLRPGTGNANPAAADPGTLYIGDVGWGTIEELNVVPTGGASANCGWPIFEGLTQNTGGYVTALTDNLSAANPLAGGTCAAFFDFQNLIIQDRLNAPTWPNPCNAAQQVPASVGRYVHRRPALDWGRGGPFRCGGYSGNNAAVFNVGAVGAPVTGGGFNPGGSCAVGGDWYEGTAFPAAYRGSYYMAEFTNGWIHQVRFNAADQPTEVVSFATGLGGLVDVEYNPFDQSLYYINIYSGELRRISFGLNNPPVVVATPAVTFGSLPLTVNFSSAGTNDPDNDGLSYLWNFGDGATSTSPNPSHTFNDFAPLGTPKRFNVTLSVTDARNATTVRTLLVSGNNTPPTINITSPMNGSFFTGSQFLLPLRATITDLEHGPGQYTCSWQATLYHNTHQHREPLITDCAPDVLVDGISHVGEVFYWGFRLTVVDAAGLSSTSESFIYPQPSDCNDNGVSDLQDIADGTSLDCNGNSVPDECDITPGGGSADCDANGTPDECQATTRVEHQFIAGPAPFSLNGSAAWPGNANEEILLTPIAGNQLGSAVRPSLSADPLPYFETRFTFRIGGGSGADGFSFCAMDPAIYGLTSTWAEEGNTNGALSICFDTYDNGGEGENIIEAKWNGVSLGTYTPTFDLEDNQPHNAVVRFSPRGLTVTVTSSPGVIEPVFDDLTLPAWLPKPWLFGFSGRTGGATNEHAISRVFFITPTTLDLNFDGALDSCQCRADFNGTGGPTVQDIFDFLASYFAGSLLADFNGNGVVAVQDIFDYLAAYFAGCE